ncbi:Thioredoxin domain-containing protein 5 [Thelohanellus kitauei]|uniref:Thioredoxin domain-containing protein 5 n=1 Tax=Thelohanellus kitauei TaxID=669202 RepID=A0A0C2N8Z6_THEKT|nr:Thioredoxin domain-containing protein 5 [Thelohanellus kitauei]
MIVPDKNKFKPENIIKYEKVSNYFQKENKIQFLQYLCSDDPEYCRNYRINSLKIFIYYHGVQIEQVDLDQKYEEIILHINDMLSKFPLLGTEGYTPTATVSSSFENTNLMKADNLLLLVFSEKCVHCKTYLPRWETISISVREHFPSLTLAKVNCANDYQICVRLSVESVPSLVYLRKGQIVEVSPASHEYESIEPLISRNYVKEDL